MKKTFTRFMRRNANIQLKKKLTLINIVRFTNSGLLFTHDETFQHESPGRFSMAKTTTAVDSLVVPSKSEVHEKFVCLTLVMFPE